MRKIYVTGILLAGLLPQILVAQGVTIGSNNPPDPSSVLDVQSVQGGVLLPRMTTVQRNAIGSPAQGLLIFNTDNNCIQTYLGSAWLDVKCQCSVFPSAAFTASGTSIGVGQSVNFSASTPGLTYSWTFAGGSPGTSSSQSQSVTYGSVGTFNAILTVTDPNGCQSSDTIQITVNNCNPQPFGQNQIFNYTGGQQTFVVPGCVTYINIDMSGAEGGFNGYGGDGGRVQCTLPVTPGETLYIYVGGQGSQTGTSSGATGGYNGGGNVPASPHTGGNFGSGGGATDIRRSGTTLNDRVVVAGGGGGSYSSYSGGNGGGLVGGIGNNACSVPGFGGTQSAGGAGGGVNGCGCSYNPQVGGAGTFGIGGDAPGVCCFSAPPGCSGGVVAAGAGGGGWYGGGSGGTYSAGGGGSSYTVNSATNVVHTQGYRQGNGIITISW